MNIRLYTKWDINNPNKLVCACNYYNPNCKNCRECEELSAKINTYEGLQQTMTEGNVYKRTKGAYKQIK